MTGEDVMNVSAALLNDTARSIFTYTAQLPYLNIALIELKEELQLNNVPVTNETSDIITVPAGDEGIGGSGQEPLPTDLIQVTNMFERTSGSQYSFIEMKHKQFLPENQVPTAFLIYWIWEDEQIKFIPGGATGNVDVQIHYVKNVLPELAASDDDITYDKAKSFLSYRTAALCAEFIGENKTRSDELNGFAGLALIRGMGIATKGRQSITTRRRPFMASWRARRIL